MVGACCLLNRSSDCSKPFVKLECHSSHEERGFGVTAIHTRCLANSNNTVKSANIKKKLLFLFKENQSVVSMFIPTALQASYSKL